MARLQRSAQRPWRRLRFLLGALLLLAGLVAVAAPTPTPTASAAGSIRLFQLNMCGHVCRSPTQSKIAAVVDALDGFHPAAAGLNEVCGRQLSGITAGIASRGWPMSAAFMTTRKAGCGDGSDFGNAVLTRARIVTVDKRFYAAQAASDGHELRGLLCVTAELGLRPTRICSTHILSPGHDPSGSLRRRQTAEAASVVGASRIPVVVMGDFNLPPTDRALDRLYTRTAHGLGRFDEVDQGRGGCRCGAATESGKKIDYIFVSAGDFQVVDGTTVRDAFSDHLALRGRVNRT